MFAVKSTYSIKTPDGKDIPFYVAGDSVYLKGTDIANEIYGSIEKCHNSLRILATNDEQRNADRRVYDEAWKILKAREKADNKYTALHEVLAKFGLAVDDLINATLDAHKAKFDKQHDELLSELRMLLK